MGTYLHYKAGSGIIDLIRSEGLRPERVKVFAAAAGGPKWFVCVGFDRALIRNRFLEHKNSPVLLAGASAGAWRCLAIAARQPLEAYELLRLGYSRNVFTRKDTPNTISEAFKKNVYAYLTDEEITHLLNNKQFHLGEKYL